jgi:putative transposase
VVEKVRGKLSVRRVHAILGWARSSHYAAPRTEPVVEAPLAEAAHAIHRASRRSYGARRMARALQRQGFAVGRERAATLMHRLGIKVKTKQFKHYRRNTKPAPADNVLNRQFDPAGPDQAWAGDITFIPTREGWLYLAVVVDLFSRRVIGWATSTVADTRLALAASELAFATRQPGAGLIMHTDQGCQYTADRYVAHLAQHGVIQSMSRKGNCWDNAVVERVFRSLKHEGFDDESYPTRTAARVAVIDYLVRFYNHERLHSTLDYRPPAEFEAMAA